MGRHLYHTSSRAGLRVLPRKDWKRSKGASLYGGVAYAILSSQGGNEYSVVFAFRGSGPAAFYFAMTAALGGRCYLTGLYTRIQNWPIRANERHRDLSTVIQSCVCSERSIPRPWSPRL